MCEMRPDAKLVLVDVPGINEAGSGGKYRTFVADKWDTFDCAIVVMDGRQGANTEEQVKLLEFVRDNNVAKKNIPIIILCNKVDDPDDEEQAVLVQEAREEVERLFAAPNRTEPRHWLDLEVWGYKGLTIQSCSPPSFRPLPSWPSFTVQPHS